MAGVREKARPNDHRSSRRGVGVGTTPVGMATTTVRPWNDPSPAWAKWAVDPSAPFSAHSRLDPVGPAKHATWVTAAGASTVTDARSMGTGKWAPTAFQYSSSWSGKPLRACRTRYSIV